MIKHSDHFHGSDLEKIEQVYGIHKEDIISFSANVNPLGISPQLKTTLSDRIDSIMSYPDREYSSLRRCIADYVKADMEDIIVGNGSTELISLFIQITNPRKALIVGPTYSEYEREVTLGGGQALYHPLEEERDFEINLESLAEDLKKDINLLILCNPNNPTSHAITRHDMKKILDLCKPFNIFVMVDETYVEFAEDVEKISSVALAKEYENLIILRGISKFFAAPGLRLGYAVCGNSSLLAEINRRKNPWTINSLAAIAGEIMFRDDRYIAETRKLIACERDRIYSALSKNPNVRCFPPAANFMLVKILAEDVKAMDLFEAAIKQGLMIRDCSTFPFLNEKFIRFCFMNPEDNDRLLEVLLNVLG